MPALTTHYSGRVKRNAGGSAQANANAALHANWGSGATAAFTAGSDDIRGEIAVTAAGTPGANPTVVVTFADGAFDAAPYVQATRSDIVAPTTGVWAVTARSATTFTLTFIGTPVAASVYKVIYHVEA